MERSLSRAVIIKTKSLPISATTFRTALSLYIAHDGRKHKHNPTLSANKHLVQICRSSLSAAADGLADGSGERQTSLVNGIELKIAQSCRKVVPKSLPVSATTLHHQECPIHLGKFLRMRNYSISKTATAELGRARLACSSINTCACSEPRPNLSSQRCCKLRLKLLLVDQLTDNWQRRLES